MATDNRQIAAFQTRSKSFPRGDWLALAPLADQEGQVAVMDESRWD
jgi:hypothetical protein